MYLCNMYEFLCIYIYMYVFLRRFVSSRWLPRLCVHSPLLRTLGVVSDSSIKIQSTLPYVVAINCACQLSLYRLFAASIPIFSSSALSCETVES